MRNLRFFIWLLFPLAAWLIYVTLGLPHVIWSYDWKNNGTYDPFVHRFYTRCTFTGPYGEFTVHHPADGTCDWFVFRKSQNDEPQDQAGERAHGQ